MAEGNEEQKRDRRKRGQVRRFDRERGFGFVRPDREHEDIFFHISAVNEDGRDKVGEGSIILFGVEHGEKGPRATKISVEAPPRVNPRTFFFWGGVGLALFVFLAVLNYTILNVLGAYLVAINLTTLALTGYDKGAAGTSALRVPESVLHLLSLLGGSVGLMLGMGIFRHKTRKGSFKYTLMATIVLQLFLLRLFAGSFAEYFKG